MEINSQWIIRETEKWVLLQDVPNEVLNKMSLMYSFTAKIGIYYKTVFVHKIKGNQVILMYL